MRLSLALMLTLGFALSMLPTAAPAAHAAAVRASLGVTTDSAPARPLAPPATGRRGDVGPGHRHERLIVVISQMIVVSPGRCWQPGYWMYQWMPQSYSYSAWVPGEWAPDGSWIAGHYEPAWYDGGYYQPLWVDGYWLGC